MFLNILCLLQKTNSKDVRLESILLLSLLSYIQTPQIFPALNSPLSISNARVEYTDALYTV